MEGNEKRYLDMEGLKYYDELLKQFIEESIQNSALEWEELGEEGGVTNGAR